MVLQPFGSILTVAIVFKLLSICGDCSPIVFRHIHVLNNVRSGNFDLEDIFRMRMKHSGKYGNAQVSVADFDLFHGFRGLQLPVY
jgi:hypothetical protein